MRWTVLVIVLLLVGSAVLIHTDSFQQFILRRAEQMARAAGYGFTARHVRLRPFELKASLSGFLYDNRGVRVEIDELMIDFPWSVYRSDGIVMNSLDADGMRVTISSPEPVLPEPSGETAAVPRIVADRVSIRNAKFSYTNQATRLEVPSFEIQADKGKGTLKLGAPVTVSPDTTLRIPDIPLQFSPDSVLFGPTPWSVEYNTRAGSGSAGGTLRWSPSIAANVNFQTDRLAIDKWDGVMASGIVRYEDGVLNIEGFRATRGNGELTGTASIKDQSKFANLLWKAVRIDPSGFRGETAGQLDLQWQASDFSDLSGKGRISLVTPDYGRAESAVNIRNGRAFLNLRAASFGADIRAAVNTGLDRRLSGTFQAVYEKFGPIRAQGRLSGTFASPVLNADVTADGVTYKGVGPLTGSAHVFYRNSLLDLRDISAKLKRSTIPEGSLRINLKARAIEGAIPEIIAQLGDFVAEGSGEIRSSATISGSLDHPVAAFVASSDGLDIEGTHIDSVQAEAGWADDVLQVTRLTARQKDGSLEATGVVDLKTEEIKGQAKVSNFRITDVRDFSAVVNLDADVSGSYRDPSATLKGELTEVVYADQEHGSVAVDGTADTRALQLHLESPKYNASADGTVSIKEPYAFSATVNARQSTIEHQQYAFVANGRVQSAGTLKPVIMDSLGFDGFTLTGEGVDLKASGTLDSGVKVDLSAKLAQLPVENVELSGDAQVSAVVHGPIDNLQIDGDLHTSNATVQTSGMPEPATVETAVDFTRDRFTIRAMRADYADARVVIDGEGTLKGTGEFTFVAENIRPERFLADRPVTGLIGISGQLELSAPRLDAIEGKATVNRFEVDVRGVEIHQTQEGEIAFENQIASIRNFNLEGPETRASAGGTVNLATGSINVDVEADTNLRILEGFIPRSTAFGRIESKATIRGSTDMPDMKGFVNLADAEIQIDEPSLLLSEVNARIDLNGSRVQVQQAAGNLNGGRFSFTGGTGVSSQGLENASLQVFLEDTTLEYPEGLESGISADLALRGSSPDLSLTGDVRILDALYRENVDLSAQVFRQLTPTADGEPAATSMTPRFVGDVNLDVRVETTGPVTIANNVARMDLYGTFRVRGTVNEPIVLGRADALEGGEVYFGVAEGGEAAAVRERRDRYIIERGSLEFNNSLHTEPTFDFEATHDLEVRNERYAIRLRATGTPSDLRTELTSDPYLAEPDIMSMLVTGRTREDLQGAQVGTVFREQALDYISGQLTSRFFRGAGTALGLDTVTIEPVTAAAEEDISARLTVGKDISRDLSVIYAQNLAGRPDQSWILNYATVKNFVVRGINRPQEDEIRMEFRHGMEFGGGPPLPRRVTPRSEPLLNAVTFSQTSFSMEDLAKQVAKPKSPYSVVRMNDDVHNLHKFLASMEYPDAKIRTTRTQLGNSVNVHFTVEQGPRTTFEYRGVKEVPEPVKDRILQIWIDGRAEATSLKESIAFLLRHYRDDGYLEARVMGMNESRLDEERVYAFQIETGPKFSHPKWVFHGVEPAPEVTDSAGAVMANPETVKDQIESQLRGKGFLDVKSTVPMLVMDTDGPKFVASVEPGLQYMVSSVDHDGNSFFTDAHLTSVVILGPTPVIPPDQAGATRPPESEEPLKPFPYTSDWVNTARRRMMTEYWQQGFNDVQIGATTHYVPGSGHIEVMFDVNEGERQQIADIQIMGDEKTLRSHVQRYFNFDKKDPVDYTRINLTRKRLYDTGLFKRVDIDIVKGPEGNVAQVNLNERAPWSVKYGFSVTDHKELGRRDRDLGLSTELTYRNLFGRGVVAGFTSKLDASFREARLFMSFPVFFDRDVASTVSLFRTRETLTDVVSDTWGVTLKQQWRLRDFYLLSYDYSYRRVGSFEIDTTDDNPDIINGVVPVARVNATLTRDTRDDIFNATRGNMFSNSFDIAPPGIGSSVKYIRNYTQYLRFREIRPRLVWASAYRLGVARTFGGSKLLPTDQFNTGSSLRAFTEDNLTLQGGNALIVTNQELRYPLFWRFGVVGFFDIGNVYQRIGVANVFRQRYSPGFGLRVDTGFLMLRVDLGMNLWARTGEDRRRISFGIGQAF
jgi:outer membrane protein assembly factor BamA